MNTLITALFGIFYIILLFDQGNILLLFYIIRHAVYIITEKTDNTDACDIV